MAFFRKADAKVRQISEPPKLFEEKFSESFYQHRFTTFSLLQYVNLSPFSLESGCKITALQHIRQIFAPSFFILFCKSLILKYLFGKRFSRQRKGSEEDTLLFSRARMRIHMTSLLKPSPYSPSDGMGNYCKPFHIVIQSEAKDLDCIEPCMFPRSFLPTVVWMTK